MLSITIENEQIENIFLKEFHSDKEKFFSFILNSFEKLKSKNISSNENNDIANLQINSMEKTWNNEQDKAWNGL